MKLWEVFLQAVRRTYVILEGGKVSRILIRWRSACSGNQRSRSPVFSFGEGSEEVMRRRFFRRDVQRAYEQMEGGIAFRILACLRSPGLLAIGVYRFGNWLLEQNSFLNALLLPVYLLLNFCVVACWGIRLRRRAIIGEGLYLGDRRIFISGMTVIGKNCAIHEDVSIVTTRSGDQLGYPIIGNDVRIGPGVRVHGKVYVGNNVRIAPNTTVDRDIPDHALVTPAPPHIVRVSSVPVKLPTRRAG